MNFTWWLGGYPDFTDLNAVEPTYTDLSEDVSPAWISVITIRWF